MSRLILNVREELPCDHDGLRIARALTRVHLRPLWADSLVDDAELCVDEAFCNAWCPTRSGLDGEPSIRPSTPQPEDRSTSTSPTPALNPADRPRVRSGTAGADLDAETGRGMFLIDSLTAHWLHTEKADCGCLSLTLLAPDRTPLPLSM
ncbi:ATP-binding protein [Nocardiopsis suaedae]|uniref:ATP-binding protein n=1 Tax=Nocardiopsis suaedae TaxID=3018444 RepID=A0ABT4TDY9_9ACTN|nr:ATP-binding protein [Nocardiopsis suaedae]MDA2802908.1 ATP-binding protein [Nocardiopsis suaedae]